MVIATGCGFLYFEPINQAPVIASPPTVDTPGAQGIIRGQPLVVHVTASDPDDDPLGAFTWTIRPADPSAPAALDGCDYAQLPTTSADGTASNSITFFRAGQWIISVQASDPYGARSNVASVMVPISDAAPSFTVQPFPIATATHSDNCGLFAPQPLQLYVRSDNSGSAVSDADAQAVPPYPPPGCTILQGEQFSFTWKVQGPSGAVLAKAVYGSGQWTCPTPTSGASVITHDPGELVCLYPVTPSLASDSYQVQVTLSDGTSQVMGSAAPILVGPISPACIVATSPQADSLVLDVTQQPPLFEVTDAVDPLDLFSTTVDGPGQLTFAWSLKRASDTDWHPVPNYVQPWYQLDLSSFGVGEQLQLRVEVRDSRVPACNPTLPSCAASSCVATNGVCQRWKTWLIELR